MSDIKTQVLYTPDTRAIHELGANWRSIVADIEEYLESIGFQYDRTLGFIRDGVTAEEELYEIGQNILEIGLGEEYFVAIDIMQIEDPTDLTYLFKESLGLNDE